MQQLRSFLPRISAAVCIAGSALLASASAQANVVVLQGGSGLLPGDERTNVLFDQGETGNPLFGDLAGGLQNVIRFSSTTDTLVTEASGQARITSTDFVAGSGATGDIGGINQLTISALSPTFLGFDAIQLNVNAEIGSIVNFSAVDQFNNTISFGPFNLGAGENRFTFLSDAVQFITSLSLTSNAGQFALQDVRQVRIGDLLAPGPGGVPFVVPGPIAGAGLPALLALGGFMWARRRKAAAA
jgi:hypothetical protein